MDLFTVGEVAQMLSVSSDTVRRWITQDRLSAIRVAKGQRRVEGPELARFVTERAAALERPAIGLASARNRLPGVVTRVVRDTVMAQVELQAGPFRVVSLMSREARLQSVSRSLWEKTENLEFLVHAGIGHFPSGEDATRESRTES